MYLRFQRLQVCIAKMEPIKWKIHILSYNIS